jgi:hypothetical protein
LYHLNAVVDFDMLVMFYIFLAFYRVTPPSSFNFVLAFNPFLNAMEKQLEQTRLAHTRACADDVGTVLSQLEHLKVFDNIFNIASRIANLSSNDDKLVLVPLGEPFSDNIVQRIRTWLYNNIPSMSDALISPHGKYLGFLLGPQTSTSIWNAAASKFAARTLDIAASRIGPSLATVAFNREAIPVLSYISQLVYPPPRPPPQRNLVPP